MNHAQSSTVSRFSYKQFMEANGSNKGTELKVLYE